MNLSSYVILGITGLLLLIVGALIDTFKPSLFEGIRIRKEKGQAFKPNALQELRNLVIDLETKLDRESWAHPSTMLIAFSYRLSQIGFSIVEGSDYQVERFTARALIQIAEDSLNMTPNRRVITYLVWSLQELIDAIEHQKVSKLFEEVASLFQIVNLRDENYALTRPIVAASLYDHFEKELHKNLEFPIDNHAFDAFLERWYTLSIEKDTFLFLLIRVLDTFRRPLIHLRYAGIEEKWVLHRILEFSSRYLKGLKTREFITQYKALSLLVTELQLLTEVDNEQELIVRQIATENIASREGKPEALYIPEPLRQTSEKKPATITSVMAAKT